MMSTEITKKRKDEDVKPRTANLGRIVGRERRGGIYNAPDGTAIFTTANSNKDREINQDSGDEDFAKLIKLPEAQFRPEVKAKTSTYNEGWKKSCYGARHTQYVLLSVASVIAYATRSSISVAIVAMTSKRPPNDNVPTYPEWGNGHVIQSAFFWGYLIPQVIAGQLAKNYGPKPFFIVAMLISSILTALVPVVAATFGSHGVMVCNMFTGLSQGFFYPSIHNLIGKWAPREERSRVATVIYSGSAVGPMLAMPITGFISGSRVGWPAAFYFYAIVGLLWLVFYTLFGSNSPDKHTTISLEEKTYIQLNSQKATQGDKIKTPWKSILTSLPFLAILVANCCQNWATWTMMYAIPSYIASVLKYNIKDNGLISALPYLSLCILSGIFSIISDYIISRKIYSIGTTRKIFTSIAKFIPAVMLVALAFVGEGQKILAITLLVFIVGIHGAMMCGFLVNHIDLSPIHAGTLMGITNSVGTIFSMTAPLFMQVILDNHEEELYRWRTVFCVSSGFLLAGGTFYAVFASGEVQSWSKVDSEDNSTSRKEEHNSQILENSINNALTLYNVQI